MSPLRSFLVAAVGAAGTLTGFGALAPPARVSRPGRLPAAARAAQPELATRGPAATPPGASLLAEPRHRWLAVYRGTKNPRPQVQLSARTPAGSLRVLLVTQRRGGWLQVELPRRPNGARGLVRRTDVELSWTAWRVRVDLRAHLLTVLRAGRRAWSARVAEGARSTPTPTGHFFVTDLLRQPNPRGIYGPWVFALSGFSPVLTAFHGGHGEIGLHGTAAPELLGRNVSHGCIRVRNQVIERLARVLPLGTPVDIWAR